MTVLENQLVYKQTLDYLKSSKRFARRDYNDNFRWRQFPGTGGLAKELVAFLWKLDESLWLPINLAIRFEYDSELKMPLSFEEVELPPDRMLYEFRKSVHRYLTVLNVRELVVPPPLALAKVGMARYNDNGEIKHDFEKPTSFDSQFVYQKFNPRPLHTREVWVPGKAIKMNNSFWMVVGSQLLKADPVYPDSDPEVTWNRIKHNFEKDFSMFDISGFGLQFIRMYLVIVADEIRKMFPSDYMEEQYTILTKIFERISVKLEDGTYCYPPRGIGLGYYEHLKTIVTRCIVGKYSPFSLYGDQGLFPSDKAFAAADRLRSYGFIIKPKKVESLQRVVEWQGYTMSATKFFKAKDAWEDLMGAFFQDFHWERKSSLMSYCVNNKDFYRKVDRILAFHYERIFGYEFEPAESFRSFHDSGIRDTGLSEGMYRTWAVNALRIPSVSYHHDVFHESIFSVDTSYRTAKDLNKRRKALYKDSREHNTLYFRYINPVITMNHSRRPEHFHGGAFPLWMDERSLVLYQAHSGTITSGLPDHEVVKAARGNYFAANPFAAYATGGYTIQSAWYPRLRCISTEMLEFAKLLQQTNQIGKYKISRYDTPRHLDSLDDLVKRTYYFDPFIERMAPPPWRALRKRYASTSIPSKRKGKRIREESYRPQSPDLTLFERIRQRSVSVSTDLISNSSCGFHPSEVSLSSLEEDQELEDDLLYVDDLEL
jgi:hypothetical protein